MTNEKDQTRPYNINSYLTTYLEAWTCVVMDPVRPTFDCKQKLKSHSVNIKRLKPLLI